MWTGPKHSGKTTTLAQLIDRARLKGISVAGILAPSIYVHDKLIGFDIVDLRTLQRCSLARLDVPGRECVGEFVFTDQGLELGRSALEFTTDSTADLIIIDEYGPLELAHRGWRPQTDRLIAGASGTVLLVVRDELVDRVVRTYPQTAALIVPFSAPDAIDRVIGR